MVDYLVHGAATVSFGTESGFDFKGKSAEVELDIPNDHDLTWKEPPIELTVNTKTSFTAVVDVRPPKDIVVSTEPFTPDMGRVWDRAVRDFKGDLRVTVDNLIIVGKGAGLAAGFAKAIGRGAAAEGLAAIGFGASGMVIGLGIGSLINSAAEELLNFEAQLYKDMGVREIPFGPMPYY